MSVISEPNEALKQVTDRLDTYVNPTDPDAAILVIVVGDKLLVWGTTRKMLAGALDVNARATDYDAPDAKDIINDLDAYEHLPIVWSFVDDDDKIRHDLYWVLSAARAQNARGSEALS